MFPCVLNLTIFHYLGYPGPPPPYASLYFPRRIDRKRLSRSSSAVILHSSPRSGYPGSHNQGPPSQPPAPGYSPQPQQPVKLVDPYHQAPGQLPAPGYYGGGMSHTCMTCLMARRKEESSCSYCFRCTELSLLFCSVFFFGSFVMCVAMYLRSFDLAFSSCGISPTAGRLPSTAGCVPPPILYIFLTI